MRLKKLRGNENKAGTWEAAHIARGYDGDGGEPRFSEAS